MTSKNPSAGKQLAVRKFSKKNKSPQMRELKIKETKYQLRSNYRVSKKNENMKKKLKENIFFSFPGQKDTSFGRPALGFSMM